MARGGSRRRAIAPAGRRGSAAPGVGAWRGGGPRGSGAARGRALGSAGECRVSSGLARGFVELLGEQPAIAAGPGEKLLVTALFRDPTLLHDDNAVGAADGGHTVGDDERGAAVREARESLLDERFRLGVHG